MNLKRIISLVLCCLLVVSLSACSNDSATNSYTAGTYTGTSANGRNGEDVVEVTVSDSTIESVNVIKHQETEGIADPAIERIPTDIVEKQSLAIDTVVGATITSEALLEACEDALKQAGADIEALKIASNEESVKFY